MLDQWELPAEGLHAGQDRGGWWQPQSESFSMASVAGPKKHQNHFLWASESFLRVYAAHGKSLTLWGLLSLHSHLPWIKAKCSEHHEKSCLFCSVHIDNLNMVIRIVALINWVAYSIFTVPKCCLNFTATTWGVGINIPDLTKWELKMRGEQRQDLVPRCSSPFVLLEGSKQGCQMTSGRFWRKKKRCYSKVTLTLNAVELWIRY